MSATPTLRFADKRDLDAIGRFLPELGGPTFFERHPNRTVAEFYHWKYFENPAGDAIAAVAALPERIVSMAAAIPKRIQVGDRVLPTYELGDFLTDRDFRGRGLFTKLVGMACEEATRRGAPFVYVRPNAVSFPILAKKLQFFEAAQIEQRRFVRVGAAVSRRLGMPRALVRMMGVDWLAERLSMPQTTDYGVVVESVTRFSGAADAIWNAHRHAYSMAIERNREYLNWRFADSPAPFRIWLAQRNGESAGYLIAFLSEAGSLMYILDLFAAPDDEAVAAALLARCFCDFQQSSAQSLYAWTPRNRAADAAGRLLRRCCRLVSKPLLHFAVRMADPSSPMVLPQERWHLALGDFDSV